MFIIGITGGTGSGKTSALRALHKLGALALDSDEIYHELLADDDELKSALEARFNGILHNGSIDRRKLAEIVFSEPSALLDLNKTTHKFVSEEIERRIAQWKAEGGTITAIDAIALIESGRAGKCDITIGVIAPAEIRISRIMKRDGITREQAEMRVNAQKPDSFYIENCDHILQGKFESPIEFEKECTEFFKGIIPK